MDIVCDIHYNGNLNIYTIDKWRCLEMNLDGQTIRFAQYAGKGFFGNYTDEVIQRATKKYSIMRHKSTND